VDWTQLQPDMLLDQVIIIHNIVFGQLSSLALHKQSLGQDEEAIIKFITEMAEKSQLPSSKTNMLLENITNSSPLDEPTNQPTKEELKDEDIL